MPSQREVYAYLRRFSAALYTVMALWLLIAGVRRAVLQVRGESPPDFAAWTSASLGLLAIALLVVGAWLRRRITKRAIR